MQKQQKLSSTVKQTPVLKIASSKIKFAQGSKRQSEHQAQYLQVVKPTDFQMGVQQHQRLPPLMESNSKTRIQKRSESLQSTVKGFDNSPIDNKRNLAVVYFNHPKSPEYMQHTVMQTQPEMDHYMLSFQHVAHGQ